ncbi:MAG: redoxin domain-containing protein [Lachnospiraceae bacterium]|nr:redoxin domain-containing protein [Lachnospiraceae bacterium]
MKKKLVSILLTGVMVFTAGCAGNNEGSQAPAADAQAGTEAAASEAAPADSAAGTSESQTAEEPAAETAEPAGEEVADSETAADAEASVAEAGNEAGSGREGFDGTLKFEDSGVTLKLPADFFDSKGYIEYSADEVMPGQGIFRTALTYVGMPAENVMAFFESDSPSDKDVEEYYNSSVKLPEVITVKGDDKPSEFAEILEYMLDGSYKQDKFTELKKEGEYTFYKYYDPEDEGIARLSDEFKGEYDSYVGTLEEAIGKAEFGEPVSAYTKMIGNKISFETKDIDGNKVTSDEVFSKNKVTMVNVWATWCGWCKDELPELEKINKRLNEKECAIVGLVGDGDEAGKAELAKEILSENGDTYLNILPWEGATTEDFNMDGGWPTSFFVDSEGKIMCEPVVGADVEAYERVIDDLLSGKVAALEADEKTSITNNNSNEYRIYVTNKTSAPLEGAMVQFCSDDTCHMAKTDKDGMAAFKVPKGNYTVHILKVPDGYKEYTGEEVMPDTFSDMHIILEKA